MNQLTLDYKRNVRKYLVYALSFIILAAIIIIISVASLPKSVESTPTSSSSIVFTNPVLNAQIIKDYSNTDLQWNATLKQWEAHKAVDFMAEPESNVYAVFKGTVASITTNALVGTEIVLNHSNGLQTVYKMLNKETNVKVGDVVETGDQIGTVSVATGNEELDGAHLHFEVWKDGSKIDPNSYLNLEGK